MKKLFYTVFLITVSVILIIVLRKPQNNLIPARQFFYMLIWVGISLAIRSVLFLWEKACCKNQRDLEKVSRILLLVYTCVYGAALYFVSTSLRTVPITDYENVYDAALALASDQPIENGMYFSRWTNNQGTLLILTLCMRLGKMTGLKDPYYFLLFLNTLQVMGVLVSLYYLVGESFQKNKISLQWTAVFLFTLWTPVWGYTSAFYSDQLSFGGGIIGMALLCHGCRSSQKSRWMWIVLAAILWAFAGLAKVTSLIPFVALAIAVLLCRTAWRNWKEGLVFGLLMVLFTGCLTICSKRLLADQIQEQWKMPVEYWVAMGLLGNGTYAENEAFANSCFYMDGFSERQQFCRAVIKENWKNLFDGERMTVKTQMLFGDGSIAPTSLAYPYRETLLWNWLYWEGEYYWKYACISTGFFFAILLLMAVGALAQIAGREEPVAVFQPYVAVFGLFLFLFLWETQNKQLYNHIPWMTLAAVYGLEKLWECVISVLKKSGERGSVHVGNRTK